MICASNCGSMLPPLTTPRSSSPRAAHPDGTATPQMSLLRWVRRRCARLFTMRRTASTYLIFGHGHDVVDILAGCVRSSAGRPIACANRPPACSKLARPTASRSSRTKTLLRIVRQLRLNAHHLRRRSAQLDGAGNPADQSAATHRNQHQVRHPGSLPESPVRSCPGPQ